VGRQTAKSLSSDPRVKRKTTHLQSGSVARLDSNQWLPRRQITVEFLNIASLRAFKHFCAFSLLLFHYGAVHRYSPSSSDRLAAGRSYPPATAVGPRFQQFDAGLAYTHNSTVVFTD